MEKLTEPSRLVGDDIDERLKCSFCEKNEGVNLYPIEDIRLCARCVIEEHIRISKEIIGYYDITGKFPDLVKFDKEIEITYGEYQDNWHSEVGQ